MIIVDKKHSLNKYQSLLGGKFSLWEKFKIGGIGSSKTVYISGIDHFDKLLKSQNLRYTSFELFPQAILLRTLNRNNLNSILIEKSDIRSITFTSRRIKVKYKGRFKIVHDAKINFQLMDHSIHFYTPTSFYKPIKKYLNKSWLKSLSQFELDPNPPIYDKGGSMISAFLDGFT